MKYHIIVDSSSDLEENYVKNENIAFSIAPLTMHIDGVEYIDNNQLDVKEMLQKMSASKNKSTSSCPSPGTYLELFEKCEYNFCITITSKLSGSYNSACSAKTMVEEGTKVHVIDSKGVSGTSFLLVDKLIELIESNLSYEEICTKMDEHVNELHLLFVISKFDNLIKNGRMNKFVGIAASLLSIKPLCQGVDGEIKIFKKIRTIKHAHASLVQEMGILCPDQKDRKVIISHCFALDLANKLKDEILKFYKFKDVIVTKMRGLASFYALEQGIIVTF